jgi:tripartite-type tricarboxylate transporter receptor subunit TctC
MLRTLKIGSVLVLCTLFLLLSQNVWAQYPDKQINLIVPFPPGGSVDTVARPLAIAAGRLLGQPIVVENHGGGAGAVGMGALKTKKPDGYWLGVAGAGTLLSSLTRKVNYDFLQDFTPILEYGEITYGLVIPADSPWKDFKDFVEYAKANPGKIRVANAGQMSPNHLVVASMANKLKINITHIPFQGSAPALTALLGKHVEAYSTTMVAKGHIRAGRLRLLVTFGEKRNPSFPDVPTLLELGVPVTAFSFASIIAPRGISTQTVEILDKAFRKAMDDPDFNKVLEMMDYLKVYRNHQETAKYFPQLRDDLDVILSELKK